MWGKKKESQKEVPSYSEEGMIVYVLRNKPEKWGKIKISGSIKGSGFKDIHNPLEVEELTADFAGGGEYTAKFFHPGGVDYIGQRKFEIAGPVRQNGEVLAEPTEEKKPTGDPLDKKVVQIEKEMKVTEAEAKQAKQRRALLLEDEEDDDVEEVDTEKEEMREKNEKLGKELEETLKRESREKEERRDREQRERDDRRDREHQEDMRRIEERIASLATQRDSGGTMEAFTAMIAAQQESTRAMMSTQQESTRAMLETINSNRKESVERSSEVTKLLLAQSNRMADVQIAAAKETSDVKVNQSEHILSVMENTWKTALAVGSGRAPTEGPKDLPGVIGDVTSRICDVVTEFIREKGKQAISPEKLTQMIRKTGQDVASGIQRPQGQRRALPPAPQATNPVDSRTAMNRVLRVFIDEMKSGVEEPTWGSVAEEELPGPILAELITAAQGGDVEQLVGVVRKYADPNMANEVAELLARASRAETEQDEGGPFEDEPLPEQPPEVAPEEPLKESPEEPSKEPPKEPPKESPKEPPKESPKAARKPSKAPNKKKR